MFQVLLKSHLDWMRVRPVGLQSVDGPHGEVAHQQEGDDLASRLLSHLLFFVRESAERCRNGIKSLEGVARTRFPDVFKGRENVFTVTEKRRRTGNRSSMRVRSSQTTFWAARIRPIEGSLGKKWDHHPPFYPFQEFPLSEKHS